MLKFHKKGKVINMKNKSVKAIILAILVAVGFSFSVAKETTRDIIFKAMKDEMTRSMQNLELKDLKKPFFISYTIVDGKMTSIKSTLGSIVASRQNPYRTSTVSVKVGDYQRNDDNFLDLSMGGGGSMARGSDELPLNDDYYGIRRALWISTDETYKSAAETFEKKLSAIKQQNLSSEDSTDDFCKVPIVNLKIDGAPVEVNKTTWETVCQTLSGIFKKYGKIFSSSVAFNSYQADVYFVNSEGSETVYPISLFGIQVNASTQADDGEPLSDFVTFFALTPKDFPDLKAMQKDVEAMAERLVKLREAPAVNESYSGPVLFEDQAVGEIFAQRFFSGNDGLIASRKPIVSDPKVLMFMEMMLGKSLDDKMDKKLISNDLTIKSVPKMKEYKGKNLIGSFQVDAEGVVPPAELVLVDKGTLKTLLSDRIPTKKIKESNGHARLASTIGSIETSTGPGVIVVENANATDTKELKSKMLEKAKEEGLEYAYIVRKISSTSAGKDDKFDVSGMLGAFGGAKEGKISKPVCLYRVNVNTGQEELVRNAELGGLTVNSMKKLLGTSKEQTAYNTLIPAKDGSGMGGLVIMIGDAMGRSSGLSGIPASIIHPSAVLLEEFDIKKENRAITPKIPLVQNPVGK